MNRHLGFMGSGFGGFTPFQAQHINSGLPGSVSSIKLDACSWSPEAASVFVTQGLGFRV